MKNIGNLSLIVVFLGLIIISMPIQKVYGPANITVTSAEITGPNELTIVFSTGGDDITAAPVSAYGTLTIDGDTSRTLSSPSISVTTVTYTISGSALGTDAGQGSSSLVVTTPTSITDAGGDTLSAGESPITITDGQKPTVSISFNPTSPSTEDSITVTFTWSESVATFVVGDLAVSVGSLSGFSGSGASYSVTWDLSGVSVGTHSITVLQDSADDLETPVNTGPASATVGNFEKVAASGDGCDGECQAPTMGVNSDGIRLVENGFTYNGKQIDVERFFTPYPLINVNVGVENTAVFKIYDNLGPDNIKHFDFAFGLASGQIMGTSNAMIQWDKSFDGIETVSVVDPYNVLDNVKVNTLEGKCRTDSTTDDCLIIIVNHTFRAPLESDIVATNVWDQRRNAWQNYYNHGVSIEGESLNPPNEYVGIYKGNLVHLIETGKNIAVDGQGNNWTFDKVWKKDYIPNGKIDDGITSHVYDRNHVTFSIYKYGQELLAKQILDEFCPKCGIESFNEINDIEFYQFPDTIYKRDDPIVQNMLEHENEKAMKVLQKMYDEMYNHDYKRIQPFQSD